MNQLIYDRCFREWIIEYTSNGIWGNYSEKTFEDNCIAIGIANDNDGLIAGIIYHDYNPDAGTIEFSAYAENKNWLTKKILNKILKYPFEELNLRIVLAKFSENNKFIGKIVKKLGATLHVLPDVWAKDTDQIVGILKKENWIKSEFYSEFT